MPAIRTGSMRWTANCCRHWYARERNVGDRLEHEFEKTLIRRALAHTGGHRMEAAAWLGWGRNTLTRKIQELGLEAELRKGMRG
jgi:two-component system nitrogen regulation response regulator GlnG